LSLLVDVFGYLSVIIHGLTIVAQSMALGGALFLVFAARPLARLPQGACIGRDSARIAAFAALALVACELLTLALQGSVLVATVDLSWAEVLGADFALASLVKIGAAAVLAITLFGARARAPSGLLLAAGFLELAAATLTTHAAARLDGRLPLMLVEGLHQLGAAIWIGGIPAFVLALARIDDGAAWRAIGARFSRMSMVGVGCVLVSGAAMTAAYVGSMKGFYGTAFGIMVGAKMALFAGLLGLGLGNFLVVERLRHDPGASVLRLKRFAEVEIGIGFSLFFAAAALTSSPPAVDLTTDRVTWPEIVARNTPQWPRLSSPDHDALTLPALQRKLDAEAAARRTVAPPAFVPGSGIIPARNAADIAWSEYNHHWAGLFVLAVGMVALLHRAGARWARHWPLAFLGLAVFLFLRSDPEVWPLGAEGFWVSLRDPEVLQHRFFVLLTVAFALFEWRVRVGGLRRVRWAPLVFPLLTAVGGAALLTHQHAIANVKDQMLIELTHTPLALAGIAAGWARWLELRADGRTARIAGWIWPACFLLIGLILLNYREA
jgi:putative copper resistance protein D